MKNDNLKGQHRVNEQIRAREVRIVGDDIESVAFSYLIISENFKVIMESEKFGFLNLCIIE